MPAIDKVLEYLLTTLGITSETIEIIQQLIVLIHYVGGVDMQAMWKLI